MKNVYYVGVDVGSYSVRAGLFIGATGKMRNLKTKNITVNNPLNGFYEQSSTEIWSSVCKVVQELIEETRIRSEEVAGIAFTGTCSLVIIGDEEDGSAENWDIIMWMDHRAQNETNYINQQGHPVLKFVGGKISVEMQMPKLLWLKNNMNKKFKNARYFFDLVDFLRWKATGIDVRSNCTVVCKWNYIPENNKAEKGWSDSFLKKLDLLEHVEKFGKVISYLGDSIPLSAEGAKQLGLSQKTQVGFSLIDAHCGVLGMLGCKSPSNLAKNLLGSRRLCIISGTSTCHMALCYDAVLVDGIWGPYRSVILPDSYLNEGGQSAAGKLLDHVVVSHPAYQKLLSQLTSHSQVLQKLESIVESHTETQQMELTKDLHIWPDFHGNRSPLSDPNLKGMMIGLTLDTSVKGLASLYLATIQALAYGSKHIMNAMIEKGHCFEEIIVCGGLAKSKLYLQTSSDVMELPVLCPECPEPVLLGAAMSAACGTERSIDPIVNRMAGGARSLSPRPSFKEFHGKKYRVFLKLLQDQLSYIDLMKG